MLIQILFFSLTWNFCLPLFLCILWESYYHSHMPPSLSLLVFCEVMPDFALVYSFIGSVFDPSTSGHLQKLKEMDPIDVETVCLLSNKFYCSCLFKMSKLAQIEAFFPFIWEIMLSLVWLYHYCIPVETVCYHIPFTVVWMVILMSTFLVKCSYVGYPFDMF